MAIKQFEVWIADLNSQIGTEAGKTRPVLIIQTNLLNKIGSTEKVGGEGQDCLPFQNGSNRSITVIFSQGDPGPF